MEEAYNELFQQFLKLRSLCLRQAALLQQQGLIPPAGAHLTNHAAHSGLHQLSRNVGKPSDFLAEDTNIYTSAPQHYQEAASSTPRPTEETTVTTRIPGTEAGENQSGDYLTSDLAYQSHVCNFCQAVFPENSTTEGEFLRHLCTHVS